VQELKELQRQGMSIQAISELTGWDRKTIREYVQAAGVVPEYGPRPAPPSKLDAFKPPASFSFGAAIGLSLSRVNTSLLCCANTSVLCRVITSQFCCADTSKLCVTHNKPLK
jgi:hypothetical protein